MVPRLQLHEEVWRIQQQLPNLEADRNWHVLGGAQFSRAFRNLIATQQLSTADAARLAAMSNVVVADSLAACFNAKYHFAFWRPYTAIHNADTDGNPDTSPDPNWIPLDVTPGHPEYPASHGCGTQALMDTLTRFFETDEVPYEVSSTVTGTTHDFTSFEDVVRGRCRPHLWWHALSTRRQTGECAGSEGR